MKILGIIPARGGSKGVPRKNIKLLGGKPLIAYTIEEALKSKLTRVIVSTEDKEIAEVAKAYGADVSFMRPMELATDNASSIHVVQHALKEIETIGNTIYDAIMLLQPTTPFRIANDINEAINKFKSERCDSVISVVNVGGTHPARMKYIENGVLIDPPFSENYEGQNRQELIPMYIRNGAIYLTRKETILKNSFKGDKSLALTMPELRSVNIDTLEDFEYAQWIFDKIKK